MWVIKLFVLITNNDSIWLSSRPTSIIQYAPSTVHVYEIQWVVSEVRLTTNYIVDRSLRLHELLTLMLYDRHHDPLRLFYNVSSPVNIHELQWVVC